MERDFRFGQRVSYFNGSYRIGGNVKGGSSSIWYLATKGQYATYCAWRERDGMPLVEDRPAFDELTDLLARAGASLYGEGGPGRPVQRQDRYGSVYRLVVDVLGVLPWEHLARKEFATLQLGGWGPDSAKGSAYQDGAVMLYDFALKGAQRTFVGLLLHEMGHSHERTIGKDKRDALREAFRAIVEEDALIGVEFLLDGESRKVYQRSSFQEFLAETYMIYVSHGQALRDDPRDGWKTVYSVFRDSFAGLEYE